MKHKLNLQMFAEEGEGTAATGTAGAETAPAAEGVTEPVTVTAGDELADGQMISPQVAAAMNQQMARHPELQKVYGQGLKRGKGQAPEAAGKSAQGTDKSIEERWAEVKKGEFADLYGRDVQNAVQDRFRNQEDLNARLNALEPMLQILRDRAGVKTDDELIHHVMDDDSLYEEEADAAGMTVSAYRTFKELEAQNQELRQREEQTIQDQMFRNHFGKLVQQAEEFKKQLPDFDLMKTLQEDPNFVKLTSPEVGLSVEDAFFALHRKEMMPQAMAMGMERAKQQMGQTIQAQRRRPTEGAMKAGGQPAAADFNINFRQLKPGERKKIYDLIHKGKLQWG